MLAKKLEKYPTNPLRAADELISELNKHLDDAKLFIETKKEYLTLDDYWAKYIIAKNPY